MRHPRLLWLTITLAMAACSGDGLFGAGGRKSFDFELVAPAQIPNKRVVQIEARVTRLGPAQYPLTFVFEKANTGTDFYGIGEVSLRSSGERVARLGVPIWADPMIRVTVHESSDARMTVSKAARIDVLSFP